MISATHLRGFGLELEKLAEELTPATRSHIAPKDFAVSAKKSNTGKPAYPIEDKQHAASALGFAKMHHDKSDYNEVRRDVERKFPGLVKNKEKDGNMMGGGAESYGAAKLPTNFQAPPMGGGQMSKMSGMLQRIGKGIASEAGTHKTELAGLGILTAPSLDRMQAHARASISGDKAHNAIEKRQIMGETGHAMTELGGLGVLAGPSAAHLLGKH